MRLIGTYIKLNIVRNKLNYLYIIISIIASYLILAVAMVYIDNMLVLSDQHTYPNLQYLFSGLRTVFIFGAITIIFSQYFNVLKSGMKDYGILKTLGATKHNIRIFLYIQLVFLFAATFPAGLFGGFILTESILHLLKSFSLNQDTLKWINSTSILMIAVGVACLLMISIGIYIDRGILKIPLSSFISDSSIVSKEV